MKIGPPLQNDGLIGPLRGGRDRGLRGELIVLLFCYSNGLLSMQSEARIAYHASMIIIISNSIIIAASATTTATTSHTCVALASCHCDSGHASLAKR